METEKPMWLVIYPQVEDDDGNVVDSGRRLVQPLHPNKTTARKQQEQWESIYTGIPARMEVVDEDPRKIVPNPIPQEDG